MAWPVEVKLVKGVRLEGIEGMAICRRWSAAQLESQALFGKAKEELDCTFSAEASFSEKEEFPQEQRTKPSTATSKNNFEFTFQK